MIQDTGVTVNHINVIDMVQPSVLNRKQRVN
jgi:hypothetical protein